MTGVAAISDADAARLDTLVAGAMAGQRYALARLVSVFEDLRGETAPLRAYALTAATALAPARRAVTLGITGTPGAGKSSLLAWLAPQLAARFDLRVAVLAIDPSSPISGGALLGDRTRTRFPLDDPRLYFRSQASDTDLGGVSRATWPVCRLLRTLFDVILIETVGIGQNEVEVQRAADRVYLVITPLGGDHVQFMKAGVMEIPDVLVLNKCDAGVDAARSYHALRTSLAFARPDLAQPVTILKTSVVSGQGLEALLEDLAAAVRRPPDSIVWQNREAYFLRKWVRDEYGRRGLARLDARVGSAAAVFWIAEAGGYEAAQSRLARVLDGTDATE